MIHTSHLWGWMDTGTARVEIPPWARCLWCDISYTEAAPATKIQAPLVGPR